MYRQLLLFFLLFLCVPAAALGTSGPQRAFEQVCTRVNLPGGLWLRVGAVGVGQTGGDIPDRKTAASARNDARAADLCACEGNTHCGKRNIEHVEWHKSNAHILAFFLCSA